ncbi:MAG: hypothetical protein K6F69_10740 [Treponema sp.]|nr:hypothetical protein [Treponema sp.]
MNKLFTPHRIFEIFLFLLLSLTFIFSLIFPENYKTWIPYPQILLPLANGLCTLSCIPLIIKPGIKPLEIGILLIQSFCVKWTGYEALGIVLYSVMIVMLFGYGFFRSHFYLKTAIISIIWLIWMPGAIPFGLDNFLLAFVTFLFILAFSRVVLSHFKDLLAPLLPAQSEEAKIKLPQIGGTLRLAESGLSERQTKLIFDFINYNSTYKELSDKYFISISTVKKDMAQVLKLFGVKNNDDLRHLLSQYTLL